MILKISRTLYNSNTVTSTVSKISIKLVFIYNRLFFKIVRISRHASNSRSTRTLLRFCNARLMDNLKTVPR